MGNPMMTEYAVLAVDGGGTRCRALLCGRNGAIYALSVGGPANYHSVGIEGLAKSLTELLSALVDRPITVQCAIFGLAGLDTEKEKQQLTAVAQAALTAVDIQARALMVENDGMMTLAGAAGGGDGMLIISGTGSIACGITQAGIRVRVGGWGSRVGDEGSGYYIGLCALNHILRAYDGRDRQSGICAAVLRDKGLSSVEELFGWLYSPSFSADSVADLAPVICHLTKAGDWKAAEILDATANELCSLAAVVVKQLGFENVKFHTVLTGGVLQKDTWLRQMLTDRIRLFAPCAQFSPPRYEPIIGGVLLGLRQLGINEEAAFLRVANEFESYFPR